MEQNTLSALEQQLGQLATPVGFAFSGRAESINETLSPEGTLIWESSFAVLALVPLLQDPKGLNATQEAAQDWIWRRLTESERLGKFLDGYLVFALESKPDDTLRGSAQALELDTAVCRKHVIWPTSEGDWTDALLGVTVLGLPSAEASNSTPVTIPELPSAATLALKFYDKHKNYETAADKLRDEATSNQPEENTDAS
jgi:hypothetical protein